MKIVAIKTTIPDDHRLILDVPPDMPAGPAEVVVTAMPSAEAERPWTLGDLLMSGIVGVWKDRTDIEDGVGFAKKLRRQAEGRGRATD